MSYLTLLQSELLEKREQIERLRSCSSDLEAIQNEFHLNQKLVRQPDLSSTTWNGTSNKKFVRIREDIAFAYKNISQIELNTSLTIIENKIESL